MAITLTVDSCVAQVIRWGQARLNKVDYLGDGATTLVAGDMIRINTAGQVVLAAVDASGAGNVHGMCLKTYTAAVPATTPVPIILFSIDTVIRMQCHTTDLPSAHTVGLSYTIYNGGSGVWTLTYTTTNGCMTVVDQPSYANWYDQILSPSLQYGFVDVKVATQAILDGRAA